MIHLMFALSTIVLSHWLGGIAAFGSTLLAFPVLAWIMEPRDARTILLIVGTVQSFQMLAQIHRDIEWRLLARMVCLALVGMPVGILAMDHLPQTALLLALGLVLVGAGTSRLLAPNADALPRLPAPVLDALLVVGGIIHGAFACGGATLVVYAQQTMSESRAFRATLTAFWVVLNSALLAALLWRREPLLGQSVALALSVPLVAVATWWANRTAQRMSQATFAKVVAALLVAAGAVTIWRAFGV